MLNSTKFFIEIETNSQELPKFPLLERFINNLERLLCLEVGVETVLGILDKDFSTVDTKLFENVDFSRPSRIS